MGQMTTQMAIVIAAGAALVGLVILAVAMFGVSGRLRSLASAVDEIRSVLQVQGEAAAQESARRHEAEKRRHEMEESDRSPGLVVRMSGGVSILEDTQQFRVGWFILLLGTRRVVVDRVKVILVNSRTPDLTCAVEILGPFPLEPGSPVPREATIGVRDLAKVSLPFIPDFGFLMDSCRLVATVDYGTVDGRTATVERDLLGA